MVGEDARAGMNLGSIIFGFGLGVFVTAIFFKVYLIRIGLGIDRRAAKRDSSSSKGA